MRACAISPLALGLPASTHRVTEQTVKLSPIISPFPNWTTELSFPCSQRANPGAPLSPKDDSMLNPDPVNLASFVDARSLHVYGASPARLGGPSLALKRAVKPVGSVAEGLSQLGGGGDGEALGGGGDGEGAGPGP